MAVGVFLSGTTLIASENTGPPDVVDVASLDINGVMRHAMTKGLCQKVIKGKATVEEQQRLAALFHRLTELDAPVGSKASWAELTDRLWKTSSDVSSGKPSLKALRKAANCTACHREHRPR